MKKVNRTCDICGFEATGVGTKPFENAGWTELRYQFGTTINAYNAKLINKDVCPKCAKDLGLIKDNPKNPEYVLRPECGEEVPKDTQVTLEDCLREFIVAVGCDEGWYRNE
jgi:hypothetical protein